MECLGFLFFLVIVLVVVSMITSNRGRRSLWNRTYLQISQKYNGSTLIAGWGWRHPVVRFRYGATSVVVSSPGAGTFAAAPLTQIEIDWPDPATRIEILSSRRYGGDERFARGLHHLAVNNRCLPATMQFYGRDDDDARLLFSDGVCWQLAQLANAASGRWFRVGLFDGRMVVQVHAVLRRFEELHPVIESCLELYDQAMLTRSVGIEFVADGEVKPLDNAKCQVCGETIYADMVFCRRCKSPHHHECWQYNGVCSIYGCGESVFVFPRAAEVISRPQSPTRQNVTRRVDQNPPR